MPEFNFSIAEIDVQCPLCNQQTGMPCLTINDRRTRRPHKARVKLAADAKTHFAQKMPKAPAASILNLPTSSQDRKNIPIVRGCLDYFPAALAAVAALSKTGNDKHNPGEELHHARDKSTDHADCIVRHLMDRGTVDPEDGIRHSVKVAWRALALLQEELEAAGEAPLARGAKKP